MSNDRGAQRHDPFEPNGDADERAQRDLDEAQMFEWAAGYVRRAAGSVRPTVQEAAALDWVLGVRL